jgi:SAM-dependent methyltransferase
LQDEWIELTNWWLAEIADDPIFRSDVLPLVRQMLPQGEGPWLDLGCGDGRTMRDLGRTVFGCDISLPLLQRAARHGAAVRCRLPSLQWAADGVFAGAYAVLVAEHVADLIELLREAHRVVRTGGSLVIVSNHPAFTATEAGPVVDLTDGEVLWRWGTYFDAGPATIRIGGHAATVHHRPLGAILTRAAEAGWRLDMVEERPLSPAAVAAEPGYEGQEAIPRLVGFRWSKDSTR